MGKTTSPLARRAIEKERQVITAERERQTAALHSLESRLHALRLDEQKLSSQIAEAEKLAVRVEQMTKDVTAFSSQLKV